MIKKIKLLIVDDEERFLRTLADRLGMRDFEVTAVVDGRQALEAAAASRFDLALVDLKMPGLSGEQVLARLKRNDPYIEVIILTGHGSIDSAVECARLGCFGYLQKPCETRELIGVLKDAFQQRLRRKLDLDQQKIDTLLGSSSGQSALGILRRLKEIEEDQRG